MQWASLLLLTSSVASIQLAKSGKNSLSFPILPAVLTVCSSGLAGLAGVIIEKMMKGKKGISIFQQNMWLNLYSSIHGINLSWSAIFNFICLVIENGSQFPQKMSLTTFNGYGLLTILKYISCIDDDSSTVVMGLITVGILKVLSSVVKSFTSSASLVLTSLLSSILFNVNLKYPFEFMMIVT